MLILCFFADRDATQPLCADRQLCKHTRDSKSALPLWLPLYYGTRKSKRWRYWVFTAVVREGNCACSLLIEWLVWYVVFWLIEQNVTASSCTAVLCFTVSFPNPLHFLPTNIHSSSHYLRSLLFIFFRHRLLYIRYFP